MSNVSIPNFGELLAPYIGQVPAAQLPNFLAMLERGAAERYRGWAQAIPEHREGLLRCAQREDEIADTVEALFPIDAAARSELAKPLPAARDTYYAVFANLELSEQLALQAGAERQGAAAWRGMLADIDNAGMCAKLEYCSRLEETSAAYLDTICC